MRLILVITLAMGGLAAGGRPMAPDFTLPDLDGHQIALRHYRGQVTLVNFWATWCAPCRIEIPDLMRLQAKYGARGLVVLGIAMDEGGKSVVAPWIGTERFVLGAARQAVNYPILIGRGGQRRSRPSTRFRPDRFGRHRASHSIRSLSG